MLFEFRCILSAVEIFRLFEKEMDSDQAALIYTKYLKQLDHEKVTFILSIDYTNSGHFNAKYCLFKLARNCLDMLQM